LGTKYSPRSDHIQRAKREAVPNNSIQLLAIQYPGPRMYCSRGFWEPNIPSIFAGSSIELMGINYPGTSSSVVGIAGRRGFLNRYIPACLFWGIGYCVQTCGALKITADIIQMLCVHLLRFTMKTTAGNIQMLCAHLHRFTIDFIQLHYLNYPRLLTSILKNHQ